MGDGAGTGVVYGLPISPEEGTLWIDGSGRWTAGAASTTLIPVEVMPVGAGKKIAYCLGCGRSGPVRPSSAEALTALRETSWPAFLSPTPAERKRVVGTDR